MKTVCILVLLFISFVIAQELENTKRIIGGSNAQWKDHTYLAKNKCDYGKGPILCGCTSTLVGYFQRYAITASHCVNRTGNPKLSLEFFNGECIPVTGFKVYPGATYNTVLKTIIGLTFTENDIAIQKLAWAPFDPRINSFPICKIPKTFKEAKMRGWGITQNNITLAELCFEDPSACYPKNEAKILQEVTEVISSAATFDYILEQYVGIPSYVYTVFPGLTCATPKGLTLPISLEPSTAKKGPCVGDSGSPLIIKNGKNDVIVGLFTDTLSTTVTPCGNGFDLFTTLTDPIVKWINDNTYGF